MFTTLRKLLIPALSVIGLFAGCRKQDAVPLAPPATVSLVSDLLYGSAVNYRGADTRLYLDVYKSSGAVRKPAIVLMHGGDFSRGNKKDLVGLCTALAKKGFTALSVGYRQGFSSAGGACNGNAYALSQAVYRAAQDLHAALRYMTAHADSLRIDTSSIFVGGAGAGAMAALAAALMGKQGFAQKYPALVQDLGGLHNSGNNLPRAGTIRGVVNMGGALLHDRSIADNAMPVIAFYDGEDSLLPGYTGRFKGCANYQRVYGPQYIHRQLAALQEASVLHERHAGAAWQYDDSYLADNTYCFVKSVLEGEKPVGVFANTTTLCP